MKKVLITGSEGFVGGHLWIELEKNGYEVFGTTLKDPVLGHTDNVFVCDITKREQLDKLIGDLQPSHIFHLAAQANPYLSYKEPRLTFEVNLLGTLNLLDSVRIIPDYKPRILVVGTSEEYGFVPQDKMPVTEDSSFDPSSPYSVSKLAAYHLCKVYSRSYGMEIVYASSFNHTGPGQNPGLLAPDVAMQIVEIERGLRQQPLLTGNLDTHRDYTDVRDVTRAYRLLIEKGRPGERYNVCSGKSVPTKEVVDILIKLANTKIDQQIDPERNRPSDLPVLYGSHKNITQETGWVPEIPLDQTLKDLLDWYRTKG